MEPPEGGVRPPRAASLIEIATKWRHLSRSKSHDSNLDVKQDVPSDIPHVEDPKLHVAAGISSIATEGASEDVNLDLAWKEWAALDVKLRAAVRMKQLLRDVREKRRKGYMGNIKVISISPTDSTAEDIAITNQNVAAITIGFEDIVKVFKQQNGHPHFTDGRLLILLDRKGNIKDYNHHILPYKLNVTTTTPDVMSDEVFESWYKTAEMFRSAIKNNSNLFPLADKYNTDDEELKRMLTEVKRANTKLGYDVLVELAFALNPESGEMVCCMCSTLDELGMPLSLRQSTRLLAVLNKINSECKSRRNSQKSCEKTNLRAYAIPSRIVCPYSFKLLEWRYKENEISSKRYRRQVKNYMSVVEDYLAMLHERGMSPLNLGLRGLMVPFQKPAKSLGS